ncbi:MAG: YdcH family protein [Rhizomicrobium sp.]
MALQGHITELSEKHKKLEELIEAELTHPDWDEIRVAALKKEKLRIKDELERLRSNVH